MTSPVSTRLLLLLSVTEAVFVISIDGDAVIETTVGSSKVAVLGSSLVSVTFPVCPGELAITEAELITFPLSTDC